VDAERGLVELDVKPGIWMNAAASQVRPRTRPSQAQLERIRSMLHEGNLQQEITRIFSTCATTFDYAGEACLVESSVNKLGLEVDNLLGVVGSVIWLNQHMDKKGLVLDAFTSLLCKKMWAVYNEYGQAADPEMSAPHRFGDPERVYEFEKRLGEGPYGAVFLARRLGSQARRAVKMVKKPPKGMNSELEQEISHLCALDHPHIIKLYEYFESSDHVYLVMDYCPGGDLQQFVDKAKKANRYVNEDFMQHILKQVLKAIAHVHARGSMHLDLKCGNIMLTPSRATLPPARIQSEDSISGVGLKPHAMLIDLGLARIFNAGHLGEPCGTPATMAPEVWVGELTPKADVFSLGVVLFEMLSNELPFKDLPYNVPEGQRYWGHTGEVIAPQAPWYKLARASEHGRNLCRDMMMPSRQHRPTASDCLHASFFGANDVGPLRLTNSPTPSIPINDISEVIVKRLSKAPSRTALQRSVSLSIARQWPANQLPSIKRAFEALDADGTGRLKKDHVIAMLGEIGIDADAGRGIVEALDLDRDGMIDWTEFVSSCIDLGDSSLEKDLRQLFNNADQDGDGLLDASDVASLLLAEHLCKGNAVCDATGGIIDEADTSAKISWKEFLKYFRNPEEVSERRKAVRASSRKASRSACKENTRPDQMQVTRPGAQGLPLEEVQEMMRALWQWAMCKERSSH
jgi:calcium-dependent protein kinase